MYIMGQHFRVAAYRLLNFSGRKRVRPPRTVRLTSVECEPRIAAGSLLTLAGVIGDPINPSTEPQLGQLSSESDRDSTATSAPVAAPAGVATPEQKLSPAAPVEGSGVSDATTTPLRRSEDSDVGAISWDRFAMLPPAASPAVTGSGTGSADTPGSASSPADSGHGALSPSESGPAASGESTANGPASAPSGAAPGTAPGGPGSGGNVAASGSGSNGTAVIGDRVWLDTDEDGLQGAGEAGMDGVTVELLDATDSVVQTTQTAGGGYYQFEAPGGATYRIHVELPAGYQETFRYGGPVDEDSDIDAAGYTDPFTVEAGTTDLTFDGGLTPIPTNDDWYATVGDLVWNDLNADGQQNPGEPGMAGVAVDLISESGDTVGTTTTDASGHYQFTGVIPWDGYQVHVQIPIGYRATMPHQGTAEADSTFGYDGTSDWFWPEESSQELTIDAGLVQNGPGRIGDLVWNDLDSNGLQDPGESGVGGVEMRLLDTNYEVMESTATDAQGAYAFNGLIPGKSYRVQMMIPTDYKLAHVISSESQGQTPGMPTPEEPTFDPQGFSRIVQVPTQPPQDDGTIDGGIIVDPPIHPPPDDPPPPTNMVGDYVWRDQNVNGIQDGGELGMSGVLVKLLDAQGAVAASTLTDPNGHYSFSGLAPNEWYQIAVQIPAGYQSTLQNQGTSDTDSDIGADGITSTFWLGPDTVDLTIDAGLVYSADTASVGDRVWLDDDRDGLQDNGELGFANVEVRLLDDADTVLQKTSTDEDGLYSFGNLVPSNEYRIEFVIPDGRQFTLQNAGPPDEDSDPDPTTGKTPLFQVQAGQQKKDIDAGVKGAGDGATIEFIIPDFWTLESATKELRIAKWHWVSDRNAFYADGSNLRVKDNFIDINPDRFKIRVLDQRANTNANTIQHRSLTLNVLGQNPITGVPLGGFLDPGRSISLTETAANSAVFESKWQLLVSHNVDKTAPPAVGRTSKAALGSLVSAHYRTAAGPTIHATAGVPAKKVLRINIKQLKLHGAATSPIVRADEVKQDLQYAREIYGQVGIWIELGTQEVIAPPAGVVLDRAGQSGLSVFKTTASNSPLSPETVALLGAPLPPAQLNLKTAINVYYVNYLTTDEDTEVENFAGATLVVDGYNAVLMSGRPKMPGLKPPEKGKHGYTTLAHELGHSLDLIHWTMSGAGDVLNNVNLMVDGKYTKEWGGWGDERRLTIGQQNTMYNTKGKWLRNFP